MNRYGSQPLSTLEAMAKLRGASKRLHTALSVPARLKHAEAAVQALQRAVGRIGHRADEDGLFDQRLERLDRRIRDMEVDRLRREVLGSEERPAGEWVLDPDDIGLIGEHARIALRAGFDVCALIRHGDRVGVAWPSAGREVLIQRPAAVAAYGIRIDILDDGIDGCDATLLSRFESALSDPLARDVIDLGTLVVRTRVLAENVDASAMTAPALITRVLDLGEVVAVPVTASVGKLRGPLA